MTALPSERPTRYDHPSEPHASFGIRLLAAFIDAVVLSVLTVPLGSLGPGPAMAGDLVLSAGYFALLEGGPSGQTVGKRLAGIRVVDEATGASMGRARGLLRHVARFISTLVLGLGYLWMLWDPRRQTWHDKIAGAVVVTVKDSQRGPG